MNCFSDTFYKVHKNETVIIITWLQMSYVRSHEWLFSHRGTLGEISSGAVCKMVKLWGGCGVGGEKGESFPAAGASGKGRQGGRNMHGGWVVEPLRRLVSVLQREV